MDVIGDLCGSASSRHIVRRLGKTGSPAGNQVTATLENVAAYDFEAEEGFDPMVYRLTANPGGQAPQIVEDEIKGKVLRS